MVIRLAALQSCWSESRNNACLLAAIVACGLATGCGGGGSSTPPPAANNASTPAAGAATSGAPMMPGMPGGAAPAGGHAPSDPATAMMQAPAQGNVGNPAAAAANPMAMAAPAGAHAAGGANPTVAAGGMSPEQMMKAQQAAQTGAAPAGGHAAAGASTVANPALAGATSTVANPNLGHAAGAATAGNSAVVANPAAAGAGQLTPEQYAQTQRTGQANAGAAPAPGGVNPMTTPMPNPMGAGLAGAVPGAPMGAGGPMPGGAMQPGGGGGAAQAPAPDSAEFPAFKMVTGIVAGEWDGIGEFISVKATGQLRDLRAKTMSETKKDELKKDLAQLSLLSSKTVSGGKALTFKSGSTIISMTVKKENGAFKVTEMTRRAGK